MQWSRTRWMRAGAALALFGASRARAQGDAQWTDAFGVDRSDFRSIGRNPYFVLEPGYQLILEDGRERLVITVLAETKLVDGVETRIVEERETDGEALVEISRNYFAISARTNGVF